MRKTYILLLSLLYMGGWTVKASDDKSSSLIPGPGIMLQFIHPELAGVNSGDTLIAECGFATIFTINDVLATTDCPGGVTLVFEEIASNINNCETADYLYYLQCTWIATDACGNQAEIYIIVKLVDTTPPTISGIPADLTVDLTSGGTVPPPGSITSFDPCGNLTTLDFQEQFQYNGCTTLITRTWTVTDRCDNSSSASQLLTVLTGCDCQEPVVLSSNTDFPCNGATGNISFATDNPGLYQYSWSPDLGLPIGGGESRGDLPPGVYTITITNPLFSDCSTDIVIPLLANTTPVIAELDFQNPLNCYPNGSITVQATGNPTLFYSLNGSAAQTSGTFTGLIAGNYQVVVSNTCGATTGNATLTAQSCTDTLIITIPPDTLVEICLTPFIDFQNNVDTMYVCEDSLAGTEVTVVVTSPDTCITIITTNLFNTIDTVCIIACDDLGNCDTTVIIIVPPPPGGDCQEPGVLSIDTAFPCDGSTGSISFTTDNSNLYQYSWSPDLGTPAGPGNSRSDLPPGVYTIVISNPLYMDCTTQIVIPLQANTTPVITDLDFQNPLNCNPNGSITVQAYGNPTLFYSLNGGPALLNNGLFNGLGTGNYVVAVSNICGTDTANVTLVGQTCTDTIIITVPPDTMVETCITPFIDFQDNIDTMYVCEDSLAGTDVTVVISSPDSCITLITTNTFVTIDTVCIIACDDLGNCDTTVIIVVPPPGDGCEDILAENFFELETTDCALGSALCLPFSLENYMIFYEIIDNSLPYSGPVGGCDYDSMFAYTYFTLIGQGDMGPYHLDSWAFNGQTFSGDFADIEGLVTLLNQWDPAGDWHLNEPTLNILGGNPGSDYGGIHITHPATGAMAWLEININLIPFGTELYFTEGEHLVFINDLSTGCADTVTIFVTCLDPPLPPFAVNDIAATDINSPVIVAVLTNDILNGALTDIGLITDPAQGIAVLNANNTITYTPAFDFCGADSFQYFICNEIACDSAWVFIDVDCGNGGGDDLPPVAVEDNAVVEINEPEIIVVLANDTLNGTLTNIGIVINPVHGSTTVNGNGTVTYTPDLDFCGADTFQYFLCNAFGCDSAWVFLDIDCGNGGGDDLPPVAVDDNTTTGINDPVVVLILANDTLNGALTDIGIVTDPVNGAIVLNGNGTVTYTPELNFCGPDSFQYFICNVFGCDSAWVFIAVDCGSGSEDLPPVAVDDNAVAEINEPEIIVVLANDTLNGTLTGIGIVTDPANGSTIVNGNGTVTYTPDLNFCGADTFQYFICNNIGCDSAWVFIDVDCGSGNEDLPPVAVDDNAIAEINEPEIIVVLANDTLNGTLTDIGIVTAPVNGSTIVNGNGTITYTPDLNFCGPDSFQYFICNSIGCDSAWVFLDVDCGSGNGDLPPVAVDDNAVAEINEPEIIVVLANDTLNGTLTDIGIVTAPVNGSTIVNGNGTVTYTPDLNFCGPDSFQYFICNSIGCDSAWVFLDVDCGSGNGDLPPVAVDDNAVAEINEPEIIVVLANDTLNGTLTDIGIVTDPVNGSTIVNGNGTVTYTPDLNFCGPDSFQYFICNSIGCDSAWVFLTVDCGEGPDTLLPIAVFDIAITEVNFDILIPILDNDTINGVLQGIYIVTQPEHGVGFLNADNDLLFAPEVDYCGEDTMVYAICNQNGCDTAIVYIDVTCLQIFNGFSPNKDNVNDFFVIEGIDEYPFNIVTVYNRWGTEVYRKEGYRNEWEGTWEDKDLPDGTYYYHFDTGEGELFVGYLQIHR